MDKNREGGRMIDKVTFIENKIHQLRQKKDRIQTQQAIFFIKEAQKILKEEFSAEAALNALKDSWTTASKTQKTVWKMRGGPFSSSFPKTHKKPETYNPAPEQSGKAEVPHHDHP